MRHGGVPALILWNVVEVFEFNSLLRSFNYYCFYWTATSKYCDLTFHTRENKVTLICGIHSLFMLLSLNCWSLFPTVNFGITIILIFLTSIMLSIFNQSDFASQLAHLETHGLNHRSYLSGSHWFILTVQMFWESIPSWVSFYCDEHWVDSTLFAITNSW